MKADIILAGVGGQGILSIAAVIGMAAIKSGLNVKQSEVHGMSQRGGAVQAHLRLSDKQIHSDLIPHGSADMILSVEPMEALRYLPYLSEKGWVISNIRPYLNIEDYPNQQLLLDEYGKVSNTVLIDADEIAASIGSKKFSNIVMLGAASNFLEISYQALESSIMALFSRKGEETVDRNLKALAAGSATSVSSRNS